MGETRIPHNGDVLELSEQDLLDASLILYGGRYELLSLVGAGAYGSVYRARDTELDEVVAVKVLRYEHLSQTGTLERFRREVRLARRVAHWNVARTFDIGRHAGERFLTMEYIQGQPLTRLCPIGATPHELPPLRAVLDIAIQLCAGLAALHGAGIVHQDMKTDNVLVGNDARVTITDFGIARALEGGDAEQSTQGQFVGTPAYMAPEQARGHGRIDTRADLYALGIVLFQMLTGQLPFVCNSGLEAALARLYQTPKDPRDIRPQLPKALSEILQRCLAREPDERFQTADELASALRAERPVGPQLLDWLKTRGPGPRSARPSSMMSAAAAPGEAIDATLVVADQGSTIRGSTSLPLPHLDDLPKARQLPVAVLLFRWLGEPGDEYLAHGLTEEIIERLSDSESLRVTGYRVVRSVARDSRDINDLAQKLEVKVVLEGSLRPSENGLLAQVRLLDIDSKLQFAARRFEHPDRNILALSGHIAHSIGDLLTVSLEPSRSSLVNDAVAVDLYLRGRHEYHRLQSDASRESISLFDKALQRVPDDPTLLNGLAMALSRSWFFANEVAGQRGMQVAMRAVEQAPESGEAHLSLHMMLINAGRCEDAAVALRHAVALSPRLAEAHESLGQLLGEVGPLSLARRHLQYGLMLDRSIPRIRISLARTAVLGGEPELAASYLAVDKLDPGYAHITWTALLRMISWTRDIERGRALLRDPALSTKPLAYLRPRLEYVVGDRDVPLAEYFPLFLRMPTASSRAQIFSKQIIVEYYCTAHHYAPALETLHEAVELGLTDIIWLENCPLLSSLRQADDYPALRATVNERAMRVRRALGISDA